MGERPIRARHAGTCLGERRGSGEREGPVRDGERVKSLSDGPGSKSPYDQ